MQDSTPTWMICEANEASSSSVCLFLVPEAARPSSEEVAVVSASWTWSNSGVRLSELAWLLATRESGITRQRRRALKQQDVQTDLGQDTIRAVLEHREDVQDIRVIALAGRRHKRGRERDDGQGDEDKAASKHVEGAVGGMMIPISLHVFIREKCCLKIAS